MNVTMIKIHCAPDEDKNMVNYFNNFIHKYPNEAKILIKGAVLGPSNKEWHNIAKHCITVAIGADILAEKLHFDREKVIKACLLHDWYKRREIEMMTIYGGQKGYELTSKKDRQLLKKFGVSKKIIKILNSNVLKSADQKYLKNRPVEEKILHYMDMITCETKFGSYKERLSVVEKKKHNIEFSESFRPILGGKSLFELNYEVIDIVQNEFEKKINLKPGTLIDFIKKKFKERLISK